MASENDLLLDLATFLVTKGEATVLGTDVFCDSLPDDPDDCVVLYEYPGRVHPFSNVATHRNVQVAVRGASYEDARKKINRIFTLFDTPEDRIKYFGTRYGIVSAKQPPFKLDVDARERTIFVFNMGITTVRDYY